MHLFHIPQCSTQNRNVHISVLDEALWDMEQVHFTVSAQATTLNNEFDITMTS